MIIFWIFDKKFYVFYIIIHLIPQVFLNIHLLGNLIFIQHWFSIGLFIIILINLYVQLITFYLIHMNSIKLMLISFPTMDKLTGDIFHYFGFIGNFGCPQQIIGNSLFNKALIFGLQSFHMSIRIILWCVTNIFF
jgi:hypothetical protein